MTSMKQCKQCGEVKEATQFSKSSSSKDKLQPKCKNCNSKDNHKFRTEINPQHHAKWQTSNWDKLMGYLRNNGIGLYITFKFYKFKKIKSRS